LELQGLGLRHFALFECHTFDLGWSFGLGGFGCGRCGWRGLLRLADCGGDALLGVAHEFKDVWTTEHRLNPLSEIDILFIVHSGVVLDSTL